MKSTSEAAFEAEIEAHLLAHGYIAGQSSSYDRALGVMPKVMLDFIQATQAKAWAKVNATYPEDGPTHIVQSACKAMDRQGSLAVLRNGFKCAGQRFRLAYFKPSTQENPDTLAAYASNRMTATRWARCEPWCISRSVATRRA